MNILKFIFLSVFFLSLGYVVGMNVLPDKKNFLKKDILSHQNLELINQKAIDEVSFFKLNNSKTNVLIYMNATCNTRAEFLEQWYRVSENTDAKIYVVLYGEIGFYINYLIYEDRRYDDHLVILKDSSNSGYGFKLNEIGASEVVLIANDKRKIKGRFKGAAVPAVIAEYLE